MNNDNNIAKHDVFGDPSLLMDYYTAQSSDLRMRHTAIWLEVKHYTWVMSFFIGAGALSITKADSMPDGGLQVAIGLSLFGSIIAVLAFLIIRRDFRYFTRADRRLLYLEKSLGVLKYEKYLDDRLRTAVSESYMVSSSPDNKSKNGKLDIPQIRTLIQTTFILYAFYGLGQAFFIYCIL